MKKILFLSFAVLLLNVISHNVIAQEEKVKNDKSDTLCILWTSDDPDVALKMVFMYAYNAKKYEWWEGVELIIWGPSAKLTSENEQIQKEIKKMMEQGVQVKACKACADSYGVSKDLKELGVDVKYMGKPFTQTLKSNQKVITF
jgi:hypothetical protein